MKIGEAKLRYNDKGEIESATFFPIAAFMVPHETLMELSNNQDEESIKANANMVLASYFSKINDIELGDRDQVEIKTKIINCNKHANGLISHCTLQFTLENLLLNDKKNN